MATAARTTRGNRSRLTWIAIGAALVVHGTVLGTVHALGLSLDGHAGATARAAAKPVAADVELRASCIGDAIFAASARGAMCFAPWRDDRSACADALQTDLIIDISTCQARNDPSTAVALMQTRALDKVKPIDPEPLLEAMQQAPKPPPPVVIPPPAPAQPPPPPPPPAPSRPMQVVETVKPATETAPTNARFLSEYDTAVKHETVARGSRTEPLAAKSQAAELQPKKDPEPAALKDPTLDRPPGVNPHAPDVPGTLSMRNPGARAPAEVAQDAKTRGDEAAKTSPIADGSAPRRGDGSLEQERHDRSEQNAGQGGAGGGTPQVPDLRPSHDVLERALGGGSVDHTPDVDNGDETALSSKKWIYASFFNRLKRQVAQNWDPGSVWRSNDPTGARNGFKTRITEVRVSLSPSGAVQKIMVTQPSGVTELDDEAVRAFRAAGPFPNPPEGLIASDKLITFAFSFYFEVGGQRSSWKVLRSM